ncbi:transcription factor bHLH112-like isoform X2 [Cornus florida]|uniref:transcription factor bHLH112-like isoform X2 n=1 Tax=Cornus florida TaxID=4283 RepID=UPI00289D262B|nr:transcription factor bHLH112-like isoform X2 [Cornus florida]
MQNPPQLSISGTILMDSTSQMTGSSLSSPATTDCNNTSLGGADSNYHHQMLQGDMNSRLNYNQTAIDDPIRNSQNSPFDKPINPSKFSLLLEPSMPKTEKPPSMPKREKPNLTAKRAVQYSSRVVSEPALKRPQIENPSPFPTLKVPKVKLGDRITALQQLVSPFGRTDTASVLSETIAYIKFLHEHVHLLSTPYTRSGAPIQHQQTADKLKLNSEAPKQDLRSRGLCLVPISSTFRPMLPPVVSKTTADFLTPAFGGTIRMQMGSSSTNAAMLENLRCRPQTCNCGLKTAIKITESEDDYDNNKGKLHYGCPNQRCIYSNWCKSTPLDEIASTSSTTQQTANQTQNKAKGQILVELDMFSKLRSQNAYFSERLQAFKAAHRLMKMAVFATMVLYTLAIIASVTGLIAK